MAEKKNTLADIIKSLGIESMAQLQDLVTMPTRILGTPHPPMVSKLATETIPYLLEPTNIPPITGKNIKSVLSGKGITETTEGVSGDLSKADMVIMGAIGATGLQSVVQGMQRNVALEKAIKPMAEYNAVAENLPGIKTAISATPEGASLAKGVSNLPPEQQTDIFLNTFKKGGPEGESALAKVVKYQENIPKVKAELVGQRGEMMIPPEAGKAVEGVGKFASGVGEQLVNKPMIPVAAVAAGVGQPTGEGKVEGIKIDPIAQEAIANTQGAKITPQGIELDISRYQKQEQFGSQAIRTGVFYLPEAKSPYGKYYSTGKEGYGGGEKITGRTTYRNPIIVKAGTGGKGVEKAYDQVKGKGAYQKMRSDVLENAWTKDFTNRKPDENAISGLLEKYGGNPDLAYEIIRTSKKGNLLPYAIQEHIAAHALREAGYDAVISHSISGGKPRLAEVFDLRAEEYPSELSDYKYEDFYPKLSTPTGQKPIDKLRSKMRLDEKGSAMASGPEIRKFIETVKNSVATDPALVAIIDSRYTPKPNKITTTEADTIINTDYNLAYSMAMEPGAPSALSNAIAIRLITQAQATKNFEEARRLVEMTAERNTSAGQAIQALSMYSKLAPEGMTSYVSSVVNRAMANLSGGKLEAYKKAISGITDDAAKKAIADKFGVPYITTDILELIYNDSVKIQSMPEGREKTVATAMMLKKIADQMPVNLLKKVSMVQTLAQLLNPKTIIRNMFGNTGFATAEELSMTMATGLDVMASLFTKQRTQALPNLKAQVVGLYKGGKEGLQEALLGIDTRKLNTKFSLPRNGIFHKGVLSALQKTLAIVLQAPDRAFFEAAYMDSLAGQCKINKSNDITPEMIEQAMQDGLYKTFQDGSVPAKFLTNLKKAFNLGKDWGLGDMVLKYPATPGNIWARGFEYSPGGFIKSTYHLAQLIRGYEKTHNQREFVRGTARAFTGSSLYFGIAAALAGIGLISGKRDPDRDVSALKRTVGMKSYQINISGLKRFIYSGMDPSVAQYEQGDTLISYDWALPMSIPMVVGANIIEEAKRRSQKETPEPGKAVTEGVAEAANSMIDQPMLSGLSRMRGASIADWIKETLTGIPASFLPTASYQLAKLADNTVRNTQDPNFFRQSYNMVAAKIPGLSKTLPEALNTFGQPMKSYQGNTNSPFNVFLNPAFVTKYKPDAVSRMVLDIYQKTGEVGHFPRVAPKNVTIDGRTIHLKPGQYHDYQQYIGNKTGVLYTILANDENFMRMPDELKAQKLAQYLGDINTSAKIELFGIYPKKNVQGQPRPYTPKGAKRILNLQ